MSKLHKPLALFPGGVFSNEYLYAPAQISSDGSVLDLWDLGKDFFCNFPEPTVLDIQTQVTQQSS